MRIVACGMLFAFALGCVSALEEQPHLQAALDHLHAARAALERAHERKGGHRARAIALVDRAIAHVERGIAYEARR